MREPPSDNQRAQRTREAILAAFVGLAFDRRYGTIRIADLVERAGIGKSTFYEHFRSKDDVLLTAMDPILLTLATAASGRAARSYVRAMVRHLWERRSTGRPILDSSAAPVLQRRLAERIRPHIERVDHAGTAPALTATGIAAAQLAMLGCWLAGGASCTVEDMTDRLIACSRLFLPGRD